MRVFDKIDDAGYAGLSVLESVGKHVAGREPEIMEKENANGLLQYGSTGPGPLPGNKAN